MITKKVAVASDHAGPEMKKLVIKELQKLGIETIDLGTVSNESVDYPDYAEKLVDAVKNAEADMGVLICGTGIGMSIAANRHREIRAANCFNEETSSLARRHNNANVLALGARIIDLDTAAKCVHTFFTTEFEGGRHQKRLDKIS